MALVKVTFATSEGKVTYSGKEIWGYLYKGKLFRSDKRTGQFAMLVSSGKICYYENGWAHTLMQENNTKSEEFAVGYYTYVSKSFKVRINTASCQEPVFQMLTGSLNHSVPNTLNTNPFSNH